MKRPPKALVTQVQEKLETSPEDSPEHLIFKSLLALDRSLKEHTARIKAIEEKLKLRS